MRRGWELTKKSWRLVADDRRLLVFPTAAALVGLALGGAVAYWGTSRGGCAYLVAAAVVYYPATFVNTFLGVAFVAVARRKLDGRPYRLADGFSCAGARLGAIAAWSLLATAVALALQALANLRGGWLATKLAGALLGLAWGAAAFFVVPVLALDGVGPIEALKRSARVIKERWGETATGVTVIGGAFGLIGLPAFILLGFGIAAWPSQGAKVAIAIAVAVIAVVVAVQTTTTQLFQLVLYRFATTGEAAGGFSASDLDQPFRKRRGLFRRR